MSEPKPSFVQSEPALVAGGAAGIVGAVMAFLLMAVSLGWVALSPEQLDSIRSFLMLALPLVAVLGPVAAALFVRPRVTPTAKLTAGATVQAADGQPAVIVPAAQAQMLGIAPLGDVRHG